jgi:hypothetical protein
MDFEIIVSSTTKLSFVVAIITWMDCGEKHGNFYSY